jgi:anti-anti-sigma factor
MLTGGGISMSCEVDKREGRIHVRGEMTIYDAAALKVGLFDALADEPAGRLDLSEVTEIDTTGLQILLMSEKRCAARAAPFCIENPSSAVREVLDLLGRTGWTRTEGEACQ